MSLEHIENQTDDMNTAAVLDDYNNIRFIKGLTSVQRTMFILAVRKALMKKWKWKGLVMSNKINSEEDLDLSAASNKPNPNLSHNHSQISVEEDQIEIPKKICEFLEEFCKD